MGLTIDLNADVGEGDAAAEEALLALVTSANVACGFHAGDPSIMARVAAMACERGVAVGAHPAFPDREGFGRRVVDLSPAQVEADVAYQVGALLGICRAARVPLRHVKPHGALYHRAAGDPVLARAVVRAVAAVDRNLALFVPPRSALEREGERAGLRVAREGFADRCYRHDGSLVPRHERGALIEDPEEAARQAVRLVTEGLRAGGAGAVPLDTICLHGDTPRALAIARSVRRALESAGVVLRPFGDI